MGWYDVVFRGRVDALVASGLDAETRVLAEVPALPVLGSPLAVRAAASEEVTRVQ